MAYAPEIPSITFVLLNISSIAVIPNSCTFRFLMLLILSLHLYISDSNNEDTPLQSGIFMCVLIYLNGVKVKLLNEPKHTVCDNMILIETSLILCFQ